MCDAVIDSSSFETLTNLNIMCAALEPIFSLRNNVFHIYGSKVGEETLSFLQACVSPGLTEQLLVSHLDVRFLVFIGSR